MADFLFLNPEDCVLDFQPLDYGLIHFGSICKPNGGSRGGARVSGGRGATPLFFLDQIEARGEEKLFGGDRPLPSPPPLPRYLRVWMTGSPHNLSQCLDLALKTMQIMDF